MRKFGKLLVVLGSVAAASSAHATMTLPASLDITSIEAAGGLVLTACVGLWAVRKVIGMIKGN